MFSVFLRRNLFLVERSAVDSATPFLYLSNNNHSFSRLATSKFSTNQHSFKITYLMDSCGLSPEIAISASEKVHFETPDRPDSVLNLLRNHGFSKTHISNIIRIRPAILLTNPEKTLLPKLAFFKSIGVSTHDIAKNPILLGRSLENQIIPSYNFLKRMLLSDEEVAAALKRARWFFIQDRSRNVNLVPNIDLLRELGVPESCISSLLTHYQEAVIRRHDQFIETVNEIKKMGFDPMKLTFVIALHIIGKRSNSTWDRCCRVYTWWGWSKDEILSAFRKHPQCMTYSEKKIMNIMDYLVKKMGWPSGVIATEENYPKVFCHSSSIIKGTG